MKYCCSRLLITAMLACNVAFAADQMATLADIQGSVLVNQHGRYEAAVSGMALKSGDRLLVMKGGEALIRYPTGCEVTLPSNTILAVHGADACKTPELAAANSMHTDSTDAVNRADTEDSNRSLTDALIGAGADISLSTAEHGDSSEDAELPPIGF